MPTSDWSIPTGKAITGATYIKDTDDNIAATIEDLVDWCNNANGTYTDWSTTGLRTDFVTVSGTQTITGAKTFSSAITASAGVTGVSSKATILETARNISAEGDIVVANTAFDGSADIVLTASFRSGMIMMWSGTVANIPSGWFLCDGANGTPDLRGRAIMGAIDDGVSDFSVGGSGNGTIPSHTHSANHSHTASSSGGSHSHSYSDGQFKSGGTGSQFGGSVTWSNQDVSRTTSVSSSHSHTITVNTTTMNTGTAGTGTEVIPKYYALCYIMKG